MEQTQLMGGRWPDFRQHRRIAGRAIGDDLVGLDAGCPQPLEERLNHGGINGAMHQLVADEPIAVGGGRVDGQQQG